MSMSAFYGPPKPEPEMINLIHHVINSGVTFLDTSDVFGPHTNEILLGKALKHRRDRVELATKFGACFVDGKREIRGDHAFVKAACEASFLLHVPKLLSFKLCCSVSSSFSKYPYMTLISGTYLNMSMEIRPPNIWKNKLLFFY